MMPISAQGYKAAWLCCLACTITFGQQVALASTSADAFVVSALGQADVRQLQEAVTPDCGLGFQPCCAGEQSCLDDQFTCIAREPVARCEPCGTPFAQPCPQSPYCEATELIPTTRRSNAVIQCRPCGQEWQPCCAVLDNLCGDGFMCYAEQDRCVVAEYADVKEEFFPDLVAQAMSTSPICGGLNDPPCMEPSIEGPTWQCDANLTTFIPVFLCMEDTNTDREVPAACGAEDQAPCVDGCMGGLTSVVVLETGEALCLKTFSLRTDSSGDATDPIVSPEPLDDSSSDPVTEPEESTPPPPATSGECGGWNQPICQDGDQCLCGLMAGTEGLCVEDPAGCLFPEFQDVDAVADQSGPPAGAAPSLEPCGKVNTSPCSKPNVRPCECPLEVDPDTGLCTSPISAGALCPQRPYCGYDKGPTCAFPFESPCDECNEVDGAANICVRNPFCTRVEQVEDQSLKCGKRDQPPCPTEPFCKGRLVPTDEGRCKRCGMGAGARPCQSYPYCKGRFIAAIEGVTLEVCEPCGGEGQVPCLHEDTGRKRPGQSPCDSGLKRTIVNEGRDEITLMSGQSSFCTAAEMDGQCGYVGQSSCSGECWGRSTASEDGLECIECGGPGQGTCDGPNQDPCDPGLSSYQEASLAPICVCPVGGCNSALDKCSEDGVFAQSGGGPVGNDDDTADDDDDDASPDCGDVGQPACDFDEGRPCADRLLPDERLICVPCGDAPGIPCGDDDLPRCGFRLVLDNDFCEPCGGPNEPVCCDQEICAEDDPTDTACDEGLFRTGSYIGSATIRTVAAEAYCATADSGNRCGLVGQPPCSIDAEADGSTESLPERPCVGLSVPSLDGTLCVPCGRAGELPCYDREKFCTGQLITIFNEKDEPIFCFKVNTDVASLQSGGDCGLPGMAGCTEGTPCFGRSNPRDVISENGREIKCPACGGADQLACTSGEPCDGALRTYKGRCIACGGLSEPVCPRPQMGPPCNTGLQPFGTTCEPAGNPPPDEEAAVEVQSFEECGTQGSAPCPGQPACGDQLFLVEDGGSLKCSSTPPAGDYPRGDDCGGNGQLVCNDDPHCDEGLFASYPEGICLPSIATAATCGTLGNLPCDNGRLCETGLAVRAGVCAPSLSQPCGIRGFPLCLGRSQLCHQLLSPSFPGMVCIDSSRSEEQPCGVLATSACLDLDCASGLVVHPNTFLCVPPADEPCGGARQTQCFWNGDAACQEGLEPKGGICTKVAS